jgi:3,4-dihydroxy 2-butanone 4-phosphate synthase/GTP cyclohydrolase II
LAGYGLELVDQVPIKTKPNAHNRKYLATKKKRMGHRL